MAGYRLLLHMVTMVTMPIVLTLLTRHLTEELRKQTARLVNNFCVPLVQDQSQWLLHRPYHLSDQICLWLRGKGKF